MTSRSRKVSRRRRARARLGDLDRRGMLAQRLDDGEHGRQPVAEQSPRLARVLRLLGERLQDLLLALRAEPREAAQPLLLGGLLQLRERRHAELLPDPARRLRAEPRKAHELDDLLGHDRLAPRERAHLADLDDLDDLLLDRLADPGEVLRLARRARAGRPGRRSRGCASRRGGRRAPGTTPRPRARSGRRAARADRRSRRSGEGSLPLTAMIGR